METTVSPISIRSTCKCGCDHPNRCSVPAVLCLYLTTMTGDTTNDTPRTILFCSGKGFTHRDHGVPSKLTTASNTAWRRRVEGCKGHGWVSQPTGIWGYPNRNYQHVYIFLASRLEKDTTMGIYHQDCILTGSRRPGVFL